MKKKIVFTLFLSVFCLFTSIAQDSTTKYRFINFGIGASGWGVPLYLGMEFPIAKDQTLSFDASYQTSSESYGWLGYNIVWRHTIIGINGSYNYYFNELIDLPEHFDSYAGVGLGYYFWRTRITETFNGFDEPYSGTGNGGIGISFILGGRYYFKDNWAVNVQLGGGTVLSSGRLGVSYRL